MSINFFGKTMSSLKDTVKTVGIVASPRNNVEVEFKTKSGKNIFLCIKAGEYASYCI
jgi:hypothetical protein